MIKAVGKNSGDWFTSDELLNFPCQDIRTIDQLWVKYSQGKFGFSVQKEIYLSVGGKLGSYDSETWLRFMGCVAWDKSIKYDSWILGHLPVLMRDGWVMGLLCVVLGLFSRTETCKL